MSWIAAKKSAAEWLQGLNLPEKMDGRIIDLEELGQTLNCDGAFRIMVLRAATRELRRRGAKIKKE